MTYIPAVSERVLCDLCGKSIGTYRNEDRSCMNWGIISHPRRPEVKRWTFLPNWWGEQKKRYDSKDVQWDFHTSCLVDVLRPLVEGEKE